MVRKKKVQSPVVIPGLTVLYSNLMPEKSRRIQDYLNKIEIIPERILQLKDLVPGSGGKFTLDYSNPEDVGFFIGKEFYFYSDTFPNHDGKEALRQAKASQLAEIARQEALREHVDL